MELHNHGTDSLTGDEVKAAFGDIDHAWYWYTEGSYEGSGYIIVKRHDGKWQGHDLGHCSCYGPLDRIDDNIHDSLEDLYNTFHDKKHIQELFDAAMPYSLAMVRKTRRSR